MNNERITYVLASMQTAREELLFRVKHRDQWLKLQLIAQVILFALALGIEASGFVSTKNIPWILLFAIPVSLIFLCLYFVEDQLIGLLSKYIGRLSLKEKDLTNSPEIIENWDNSAELKSYVDKALPLRFIAQLLSFFLIPMGLLFYYVNTNNCFSGTQITYLLINVLFLFFILSILIYGFSFRKNTGKV